MLEEKKKQEELEAAKAYAAFVDSFAAPDKSAHISTSFVKGGLIGGDPKKALGADDDDDDQPRALGLGAGSAAIPKKPGNF